MKKYLQLLLVALFATLSFSLTSCGDDDEPDGGDSKANLTINGQGYKEHSATGATSSVTDYGNGVMTIHAELYPASSDEFDYFPRANVSLEAKSATFTKGMTLDLTDGYVEMVTDVMEGDKYDEIKSGKITVSEVKGETVTLKFDNLKLSDGSEAITINGSLKCEYTVI